MKTKQKSATQLSSSPKNSAAETVASLKDRVREFWDAQSCDTQIAHSSKHSLTYFEEMEKFRYFDQPFIHSFAQFTRYKGKKVLEVGFGAGTDFIQWLRAGAAASGVDLTLEAFENTRLRIAAYSLPPPECLEVADAENLPFESGTFDLVYSFGVLHHTPNTEKALQEAVRVTKPGGQLKLMLYNRRSIYVFTRWLKFALLKGRPWRSFSWVAANFIESPGTKAYSRRELANMLSAVGLERIQINTEITSADYLGGVTVPPLSWLCRFAIRLTGQARPWRPEYYTGRINDPDPRNRVVKEPRIDGTVFTGNPLGFFHCITAEKGLVKMGASTP